MLTLKIASVVLAALIFSTTTTATHPYQGYHNGNCVKAASVRGTPVTLSTPCNLGYKIKRCQDLDCNQRLRRDKHNIVENNDECYVYHDQRPFGAFQADLAYRKEHDVGVLREYCKLQAFEDPTCKGPWAISMEDISHVKHLELASFAPQPAVPLRSLRLTCVYGEEADMELRKGHGSMLIQGKKHQ